ncbi:MAG: hypothetical protein ACJ762_14995 [Solirubrobacteraceae bacterium]
MKVRALCATGLVAVAAAPATASAGTSIRQRLHRADVALNRAEDAVDDGNDAKVVSSLRGVNRQTSLALKATLRLVARDRDDADVALADTAEQLDTNAQAVTDMLGDASADMVTAINTTLAATDTGRGQILTTIQGLGDLEPDWADALTQLADDAVNEVTVAADNAGSRSPAADDALDTYIARETDAAGAIVAEVAKLADEGDAELDGDLLDTLASDIEDAVDALDSVPGADDSATKLTALGDVVVALADDAYGYDEEGYWGDDEGSYDEDYVDGYTDGYADAFDDWGWLPRGHGYRGWDDEGFGSRR